MTVAWTWRLDVLKSIAGFPMSKQTMNRSGGTSGDGSSTRQPKLLAVMVLVGGAISTWCWYKPLPTDAKTLANGLLPIATAGDTPPETAAASKSHWGLEGLVFPSFYSKTSVEKSDHDAPRTSSSIVASGSGVGDLPGDLVGDQELYLTPYQRLDVPIKDRVAGEPLPIIPVTPPLHNGAPVKPPLWVDGNDFIGNRPGLLASQPTESSSTGPSAQRATNSPDLDAPSPFRIPQRSALPTVPPPSLADSKKWPDEGFQPAPTGTSFRSDRQLASGNKFGTEGARPTSANGKYPMAQAADSSFVTESNNTLERDRVMAFSSNRIRTKEVEELELSRDNRRPPENGLPPARIRIPNPSNVIRQPSTSPHSGSGL